MDGPGKRRKGPKGDAEGTPFHSTAYWQKRYRTGGNSGAGSYGRLSVYKAQIVNELVFLKDIRSAIEHGSGDGNQASLFTIERYTGLDVSEDAIRHCREIFAHQAGWTFLPVSSFDLLRPHELALSLDVIYHLIEDDVFEDYMTRLFDSASHFVLVYASDHDERMPAKHVRHRAYSEWIAANRPDWQLAKTFDHPFPRHHDSDPNATALAFFRLYEKAPGSSVATETTNVVPNTTERDL